MEYGIRPMPSKRLEDLAEDRDVRDVRLDFSCQVSEAPFGKRDIQEHDGIPALHEGARERGTEEASPSGDEGLHGSPSGGGPGLEVLLQDSAKVGGNRL
jgi:hypothetical protein